MAPHRIMVTYPNNLEISLMKDVGIAAMKAFLRDAKKVAEDVQTLKVAFKGMADDIQKLEVSL